MYIVVASVFVIRVGVISYCKIITFIPNNNTRRYNIWSSYCSRLYHLDGELLVGCGVV